MGVLVDNAGRDGFDILDRSAGELVVNTQAGHGAVSLRSLV